MCGDDWGNEEGRGVGKERRGGGRVGVPSRRRRLGLVV